MLALGLSMLWETVDPEAALRDRFGFEDLPAATTWCADVLLAEWGIELVSCGRLVISDRNAIAWVSTDAGGLVVTWSVARDRFARLTQTTELLRVLADRDLPVARPVPGRSGGSRIEVDGPGGPLSVAVLPELPGDWLDVADHRAVHAAGACLARLHAALGSVPPDTLPDLPRIDGLRRRIAAWREDDDLGIAPAVSRRLDSLLAAAPELDDAIQPVHNDFRAANVLTRGSTITGVLDLDDAVITHRVLDLAKASVLLATRFTDWRPSTRPVRARFREGYESVRPLTPIETQWFDLLSLWIGLQVIPPDDDGTWAAAV